MSATIAPAGPPWREEDRLEALRRYQILDTPPEADFDDFTRIASQICGVPMALISLVDDSRQWFKSAVGLNVRETPREVAFCAHAIQQEGVFEVTDAQTDSRFAENPLVTGDPNLRFYAGAPLETPGGLPLGTLCVLDTVPRALTADQREGLAALARQVMGRLELRRALTARHRDEERHRFILESAVDYGIISMDLDGTVTSWNEGARRIFGWTEQEMCGSPCNLFFTPEDRDAGVPEREMGEALARGRGRDERWHLRRDGSCFWANGEMMPLTDDTHRPVGFIKIVRDRTEQRRVHELLAAAEARFQLALESAGFIGSWDWDITTDTIYADPKFCEFFSVDPARGAEGLPIARFIEGIHPDDREWVGERIDRCVKDGGQFAEEYRLLGRHGRVRWVLARGSCQRDAEGRPVRFPGVAVDITDRKLAEIGRQESESRVQLALIAGELGAWESDAELGDLRWDTRTRELLGHREDEPLDYAGSFMSHVHADDRERLDKVVKEVLAEGPDGQLDTHFRTIDDAGVQRWVHTLGALMESSGGSVRFVGTVRDVTALKEAEERRALLTAELQHRIKNMLSIVQAIVSQSLRTAATPAEARDAITRRLIALGTANDLLVQNHWKAAPIGAIIEGAVQLQEDAADRITIAGPDLQLNARAALAMAMALHELGTNAAKYGALSVDEGRVAIDWSTEDDAFEMRWIESGGPIVRPPERTGFGTRLMTGLGRDLGGETLVDYRPEGVRWTLRSTLAAIREE